MLKLAIYHFLHVGSLLLLAGYIFYAFANPTPKTKRMVMMTTGILQILILISGFGMLAVLKLGFPVWIMVKIICWLGLAALPAFVYRKPKKTGMWTAVAIVLLLTSVAMVYFRPF